jgi:hypothetical protein
MVIVVLPTPPSGLKTTTIWPRWISAEEATPTSPSRRGPRESSPATSARISMISARRSIASARQRSDEAE